MAQQTINVEGMSCEHCVQTITKAVGEAAGVQNVSVNLEAKNVSVDYDETAISLEDISAKITEAGFEVK